MGINSLSATGIRDTDLPEIRIPNISIKEHAQNAIPEHITKEKMEFIPVARETKGNQGDEQKEIDSKQLKNAIDMANSKLKFQRTRCEFKYYEDVNRVAIKVIDLETEEVIREIPPEETIELVQKLWEMAGIIVDERR